MSVLKITIYCIIYVVFSQFVKILTQLKRCAEMLHLCDGVVSRTCTISLSRLLRLT